MDGKTENALHEYIASVKEHVLDQCGSFNLGDAFLAGYRAGLERAVGIVEDFAIEDADYNPYAVQTYIVKRIRAEVKGK